MLCGKNEALDSIMGKVDEIKGKLAEGMGALGDLEAKAGEALGELQAALPELPSVTSLQGDLSQQHLRLHNQTLRELWIASKKLGVINYQRQKSKNTLIKLILLLVTQHPC